MPRMRLNEKTVRGLTAEPGRSVTEVWDTVLPGFGVRVFPSGRRSWFVRYRESGKQVRSTLGRFPKMGVAEARDRARRKMDVREVAAGQGSATVADLAEMYLELHAPRKRASSQREDRRILSKDILPALGECSVEKVDVSDIAEVVDGVARRGSPIMANRTRALMSKLWNFGMARGVVSVNPVAATDRPGVERPRDRVLSDGELRVLWTVWEREASTMSRLFQMLLLTAQRSGEVKAMRWKHIDDDLWTIPGKVAKNGKAHVVPLSTASLDLFEILKTGKSQFVFPGKKGHLTELGTAFRRYRRESEIQGWSPHDLRRTVTSRLGEMGTPPHVLGAMLNHTPSGVTQRVYNRYLYLDEVREALEVWGKHVRSIVR